MAADHLAVATDPFGPALGLCPLGLLTAGIGAVAHAAIQSGRAVKAAKLLEKIYKALKRIPQRHYFPKKHADSAKSAKALRKAEQKGMPEVGTPAKKLDHVDDLAEKEYDGIVNGKGPKTAVRTGVGLTGEGIPIERVKPKVLKEIDPDSKAAYGYSPKKGTAYDKFDFTDVDAAKKNQKIRTDYLDGSKRLEHDIETMRAKGASSENIGQHVVNERNLQKVEARKYMNAEEIKVLEERNLKKYKNPVGPTPEQAFKSQKKKLIRSGEYSSDSQVWDRVIEKSMQKDDVINTLLGIEHH